MREQSLVGRGGLATGRQEHLGWAFSESDLKRFKERSKVRGSLTLLDQACMPSLLSSALLILFLLRIIFFDFI